MQSQPEEENSSARKLISVFTRPPVNKNSTDVIIILFLSPQSTVVFPNASMVLTVVALFSRFFLEIFKRREQHIFRKMYCGEQPEVNMGVINKFNLQVLYLCCLSMVVMENHANNWVSAGKLQNFNDT